MVIVGSYVGPGRLSATRAAPLGNEVALMADPPTARDYAGIHTMHAVCPACDRWVKLGLAELVAAGQGDGPLIELKLRCSACGRTGHQIKVSGRSYGLAE
jgi:hypothetical protein